MAPLITLYILGGCVGVAAILFVVMIVVSAIRPPRLPDVALTPEPPLRRIIRALTPQPLPLAPAMAGPPIDSMFDDEEKTIPARPKNAVALVANAPKSKVPPALPGVSPRPPAPPSLPGVLSRSAVTEFESPRAIARPAPPPSPVVRSKPPTPAPPSAARTKPPTPAPPSTPRAASSPSMSSTARTKPPTPAPSSAAPPATASARPMPASFAAAPALMPSRWSPDATSPGSFASVGSGVRRMPVYPAHPGRTIARFVGGLVAFVVIASSIVVAKPGLLDPACDELEWFGNDTAIVLREHARDANVAAAPYVEALLAPALSK